MSSHTAFEEKTFLSHFLGFSIGSYRPRFGTWNVALASRAASHNTFVVPSVTGPWSQGKAMTMSGSSNDWPCQLMNSWTVRLSCLVHNSVWSHRREPYEKNIQNMKPPQRFPKRKKQISVPAIFVCSKEPWGNKRTQKSTNSQWDKLESENSMIVPSHSWFQRCSTAHESGPRRFRGELSPIMFRHAVPSNTIRCGCP